MSDRPIRVVRRGPLPTATTSQYSPFDKGGSRRNDGGIVARIQNALSIERGWRRKHSGPEGGQFEGYFHACGKKFPGKATVTRTAIDIYIRHPPPELQSHRHWQCFFARSDGWYWIHHTSEGGLESAILEIEAILNECQGLSRPAPQKTATVEVVSIEKKVGKLLSRIFDAI